ncbi:MAG: fibronectin type III domain-containing protein [Candidatus Sulfobium sp.]
MEPGFNWRGSMMAQSARDFLFFACLTVAAQDSTWAIGRPNATDICERCHFPKGWIEGRSDPTNASLMTGSDHDGVQCDFCHNKFDPFFEGTHAGTREGNDWLNYWDETNLSSTPSQTAADNTYDVDKNLALNILLFNGRQFYGADSFPFSYPNYSENASGQYFLSGIRDKRASFADANARHPMLYSRYHKSKYFCSTCHDVSNPILANYLLGGVTPEETRANFTGTTNTLWTENHSASSYFHVERTFSEFMLSAYGQQGGAPGIGPFAPDIFNTSYPDNYIAKCQDCHMRDVVGKGCSLKNGIVRTGDPSTTESIEHPNSGEPLHDLTGGNAWVSYVLASAISGSPNYDATNAQLLNQGPSVLTLDLSQGLGIDPVALLAGVDRAKEQLRLAASIEGATYNPDTGALSFKIQNQTAHKLISGFPEGRRMFVNIRAYNADNQLIYEVNPYDYAAGTLIGLTYNYQTSFLAAPAPLGTNEVYDDELVYEDQPSSTLTGESDTFHFALATDRYKDNRIPPKGFRINEAAARLAQPRWHGADDPGYFTAADYAGGYDAVTINIPAGAAYVEINLYYQTTSREYIEFLRDEINGNPNNRTLPASAYIVQTDPFFSQLKAWGNTIWSLWTHNMNVDGAKPFLMAQATITVPSAPTAPTVTTGSATNITATSATLNGTVNPNGTSTTAYFQYGMTVSYDNSTPFQSVGNGTSNLSVSDILAGLSPNYTYHYRIVASSSAGTSYGSDMTFTTTSSGSGLVRKVSDGTTYSTIQGAYSQCSSDDILEMQASTFIEDLDFSSNISVFLEGGYDSSFTSQTGFTIVQGTMTITAGKIRVENLIIE